MDSNDLNRRMRYALMLDDADVGELLQLAGFQAEQGQIAAWREREGAEGYLPCPSQALNSMLDGLIVRHRGAREDAPPATSGTTGVAGSTKESEVASRGATNIANTSAVGNNFVDNNEVLKKLRIALSLKTDDVHAVIVQGGGKVGSSEVGALFRKPTARNYRRCGDQVLRWFLAGLAARREEQ